MKPKRRRTTNGCEWRKGKDDDGPKNEHIHRRGNHSWKGNLSSWLLPAGSRTPTTAWFEAPPITNRPSEQHLLPVVAGCRDFAGIYADGAEDFTRNAMRLASLVEDSR